MSDEGDSIIVGPWTQAGRNPEHYFGTWVSQLNLVHKSFVQIAERRQVLELKVLRLEEGVKILTKENLKLKTDLVEADTACEQLRDSARVSGDQYEKLIQDLAQSDSDLHHMAGHFNGLYKAYRNATGTNPPDYDPATEGETGPDSYLQAQKNARLLQHPEPVDQLTSTNAPDWGSLDPSKFTASQEEAMAQAESQKQLSPVRKRRSSRSRRADVGPPPLHSRKPKTNFFPPPPVLNLAGATVTVPVGSSSSVQSNHRRKASVTSGRSPNKAAARSSITHLLVQPEHPTFISDPHASTSASHLTRPLLPPIQLDEAHQHHGSNQDNDAAAPKTSSSNRSGCHQSDVVHTHAKNLDQRRKQVEAIAEAEAHRSTRTKEYNEKHSMRKVEHRALLDRCSKELQMEMGVDLGDLPPPGHPPQKERWKRIHVGETMYAPRYVTPEPIIKTEEQEAPLDEDEPQAGAGQHNGQGGGHANPPANKDYDRGDEGEDKLEHNKIAGDDDWYRESPIPSGEGSQFDPEDDTPADTHQTFLLGDPRYRYHGAATKSPATATNGSSTSRKSKHGERQDTAVEEIVPEIEEPRPTKRRRMATRDPVPGPSQYPNALAGPSNHPNALTGPSNLPTALTTDPPTTIPPPAQNKPQRRSSARISDRRRTKNVAKAKCPAWSRDGVP